MASRPIFLPKRSKRAFVREVSVEFKWFAGMAASQKQKSIDSLHAAAQQRLGLDKILEISSKSRVELGVKLSAFNLNAPVAGRIISVEVAFQASKVFENGGPYIDLLEGTSREAKGDPRLKASGRLMAFSFEEEMWPLEPRTAFYDWIYLRALQANTDLARQLLDYEAFTDIEFNPDKSINCQAQSAALYVSLHREGLLSAAMASKDTFLACLQEASTEKQQQNLF